MPCYSMRRSWPTSRRLILASTALLALAACAQPRGLPTSPVPAAGEPYEIVILGGRVMDP